MSEAIMWNAGAKVATDRITSWIRDRSGSTAIEFSMVLAPLLLVTLGAFDTGMIAWKQAALQNGVGHVQRLVRTGAAATMSRSEIFVALCRKYGAIGTGDCQRMDFDIRPVDDAQVVPDLTALRLSDALAFDPGTRGSLVLIRAFDIHRLVAPTPTALMSPAGREIAVTASALAWVEP